MIYVEVEQDSLAYVRERLGSKADKAPIAVRNAANDTAVWARKQLLAEAQSRYTVKAAGFNKHTKIRRATLSTLTAIIDAKSRTLTMPRFHTTASKRSGVKVEILSGTGLKQLISETTGNKAFLSSAATGDVNVKGRLMQERKDAQRAYSSVSKLSILKSKTSGDVKTANLILQRETKDRYPIKGFYGSSVPKMIEMVYSRGRITDEGLRLRINDKYQEKLNYQIERILSQE